MNGEWKLGLQDTQWECEYTDHDRNIARATVYDEDENFYFVRVERDDDFGKATLKIESFHLSTLKLSYEEAVREYEYRAETKMGTLIANRELPILRRAKEMIDVQNG